MRLMGPPRFITQRFGLARFAGGNPRQTFTFGVVYQQPCVRDPRKALVEAGEGLLQVMEQLGICRRHTMGA